MRWELLSRLSHRSYSLDSIVIRYLRMSIYYPSVSAQDAGTPFPRRTDRISVLSHAYPRTLRINDFSPIRPGLFWVGLNARRHVRKCTRRRHLAILNPFERIVRFFCSACARESVSAGIRLRPALVLYYVLIWLELLSYVRERCRGPSAPCSFVPFYFFVGSFIYGVEDCFATATCSTLFA